MRYSRNTPSFLYRNLCECLLSPDNTQHAAANRLQRYALECLYFYRTTRIPWMSTDGQGTKWRRNIAENYNRLNREHERYRRQTDGRQHRPIANVKVSSNANDKVSSRSLIMLAFDSVMTKRLHGSFYDSWFRFRSTPSTVNFLMMG